MTLFSRHLSNDLSTLQCLTVITAPAPLHLPSRNRHALLSGPLESFKLVLFIFEIEIVAARATTEFKEKGAVLSAPAVCSWNVSDSCDTEKLWKELTTVLILPSVTFMSKMQRNGFCFHYFSWLVIWLKINCQPSNLTVHSCYLCDLCDWSARGL